MATAVREKAANAKEIDALLGSLERYLESVKGTEVEPVVKTLIDTFVELKGYVIAGTPKQKRDARAAIARALIQLPAQVSELPVE